MGRIVAVALSLATVVGCAGGPGRSALLGSLAQSSVSARESAKTSNAKSTDDKVSDEIIAARGQSDSLDDVAADLARRASSLDEPIITPAAPLDDLPGHVIPASSEAVDNSGIMITPGAPGSSFAPDGVVNAGFENSPSGSSTWTNNAPVNPAELPAIEPRVSRIQVLNGEQSGHSLGMPTLDSPVGIESNTDAGEFGSSFTPAAAPTNDFSPPIPNDNPFGPAPTPNPISAPPAVPNVAPVPANNFTEMFPASTPAPPASPAAIPPAIAPDSPPFSTPPNWGPMPASPQPQRTAFENAVPPPQGTMPQQAQPAVTPAAQPGAMPPAETQDSRFNAAMGTIGSAYTAVVSSLPGRDSFQAVGRNLGNVLQPGNAVPRLPNPFSSGNEPPPTSPPVEFSPTDWRATLQRMIDQANAELAHATPGATEGEKQRYIEKHVNLRMLYLIAAQQERALQVIPGIDSVEQEFWQQIFWSLANYLDRDAIPDTSDRATQTVAQLRAAIQRLEGSAKLEMRNVNFCHKISSYGNYERFPREEFTPGQPILVYAEVENFQSESTPGGYFRTVLNSTIDIYQAGPNGKLVQSIPFQPTEDLSRNRRRDYFHSWELSIPPRISMGPHVMRLTIEDQFSRKTATYSLNFIVK